MLISTTICRSPCYRPTMNCTSRRPGTAHNTTTSSASTGYSKPSFRQHWRLWRPGFWARLRRTRGRSAAFWPSGTCGWRAIWRGTSLTTFAVWTDWLAALPSRPRTRSPAPSDAACWLPRSADLEQPSDALRAITALDGHWRLDGFPAGRAVDGRNRVRILIDRLGAGQGIRGLRTSGNDRESI